VLPIIRLLLRFQFGFSSIPVQPSVLPIIRLLLPIVSDHSPSLSSQFAFPLGQALPSQARWASHSGFHISKPSIIGFSPLGHYDQQYVLCFHSDQPSSAFPNKS
jgi:hypothetical protein